MGSASLADGQGSESPQDQSGLHVCHSCRWTFPNSHPSARQRRAHRRHCGKIDGFPLIPSHREDGGRSDGEENDANAGATAAPADPHLGKISEVDLDRKRSLIASAGWTVETSCETGEGRKRSGPVGVCGVEAQVEIPPGNAEDPYADETFEFPDPAHGKEIRGADLVGEMEQPENSKKLDEHPTTGSLASNVQGTRSFAEIGDTGGDTSLSTAAPHLDCCVNEMCADEDENALNEFLAEIELAVEERLREGRNLDLESPSIEAQEVVYAMDTEKKLFKRNNSSEIGVLSNPTSDIFRQETAPITDISMNLKTVGLESDIDGKNSRFGLPSIVPVSFSVNQTGGNSNKNVLDEALVETRSAAAEGPWEEYNSHLESFLDEAGKGNALIDAELRSLDGDNSSGIEARPELRHACGQETGDLGTDTPMNLEEPNPEATLVQELDNDVDSTSALVINPLDYSVNGMSGKLVVKNLPDESLFETEPCAEEVPKEKTVLEENAEDHSLPVFQLLQDFSSHVEIKTIPRMPVDDKTSFMAGDHLKDVHTRAVQSEGVPTVSGKVNHEASEDQGPPEADTTLETAVTCVELRPADPVLEEMELGSILKEAVQNLVPFIGCGEADGDYTELENGGSKTIENKAGENKNIADEDSPADREFSHGLSDELMSEEGSTYNVFKFLIQPKGDKNDGHVAVENSRDDQDSILKQSNRMIDPESTSDNFHPESQCSQDGEECRVERTQSLAGSVSMLNGSSQASSPMNMGSEVRNFISLEAWIDDSAGVETNQKEENEGSLSIIGAHTVSKSDITEETQQSRIDSESVRRLRETVKEPASQHRQSIPTDAPGIISQEYGNDGLNQHNDVRSSDMFVETLGTALSPGTRNSVSSEEPRRGNEEIISSFGHRSDDRAGHFIPKQVDKAGSFSLQDAFMDTPHRTDIIEAHWGSVSAALPGRDPGEQPLQDLDAMPAAGLRARRSGGSQEPNLAKKAASVDRCSEISEALSDVSPVDPQQSSSTQARRRGEILPKLESWSSGKLHTPLKSLLMEANSESRQEPLNPLSGPPPQTAAGGSWAPREEAARASRREAQKEWSSPARLPGNQSDRRRIKGRPQWVPFLCCPSLN